MDSAVQQTRHSFITDLGFEPWPSIALDTRLNLDGWTWLIARFRGRTLSRLYARIPDSMPGSQPEAARRPVTALSRVTRTLPLSAMETPWKAADVALGHANDNEGNISQ